MSDMDLSEDQRLMRQTCREFVDDVVTPFMRDNWQREWQMNPEGRLPPEILQGADVIGIRTLGVPEEFGGIELEPGTEVQTFALIAEEIARGDSGLADKLVQNWKVSVLLRHLAPTPSSGALVQAPGRRSAIPAGALPDRAARRLGPLAALQRARSRDADPRGEARATNGSSMAANNSSPTAMTPACTSSMPTPTPGSACCRARQAFWCRATRRD